MAMKAGRLSLSVITREFAQRASERVARTSNFRKIPENCDFTILAIFSPKMVQIFQIIVDNDLKPVKSVKLSCSLPLCEVLCPQAK